MKKNIIKNLSFGYMPSFNNDLLSEIKFAKNHFEFIEITLKYNLKEYTQKYLNKIKKTLGNFELLGHVHWKVDLTKTDNTKEIKKILKNIEIYKFLGAKKITIHPSSGGLIDIEQIKKRNLRSLNQVANLCSSENIKILVENGTVVPFNSTEDFVWLFDKIPNAQMTLDIGHADFAGQDEWEKYLIYLAPKIQHIHLHRKRARYDHLPFYNQNELNGILRELNKLDKKLTISLEIFYNLENNQRIPIEGTERKKIILDQLKLIRNL